jgi:hypothetical protein
MTKDKGSAFKALTGEEKKNLPLVYQFIKPANIDKQAYYAQIENVKGACDVPKGYYKPISRFF